MAVYSVTDISSMLNIKPYLLRQWEDTLQLQINRNSKGSRIYDDNDLEVFKKIKALRDKNVPLDVIKDLLIQNNIVEPSKAVTVKEPPNDIAEILIRHEDNIKQMIENENAYIMARITQYEANINAVLRETMKEYINTTHDEIKTLTVQNKALHDEIKTMKRLNDSHFKNIDSQLTAWREKKPWYKKIF